LEHDLRTPPQELRLKRKLETKDLERMGLPFDAEAEEQAMFVPVDTRTFVASLLKPGDEVSFVAGNAPTRAGRPGAKPGVARTIGPFRVLAIGNRLSSIDVMKAAQIPQRQENVMTISVGYVKDPAGGEGQFDPRTTELLKYLRATDYRGMGVTLHAREP
jgi:hypothetical protein